MSDFDDDEINALAPSNAPEEDKATGGLKRPREPSPPPPSQALAEDFKKAKSSSSSGEEEEEEEDEPKKKKRRLKNKAEKELGRTATTLMDDLFGDEEPSFAEEKKEEEAPKKKVLTLDIGDKMDQEEAPAPAPPQDEEQPEGPTVFVDDEQVLPGVGGSGQILEVYCSYAEDPNLLGWTPVTSTESRVDLRLQKLAWGIFMRRAHDPKEAKENRWFVILAPDALMRCLGSPFFFSSVAVVRVDGKVVTMEDDAMGSPPIYYAYHLVSKEPIWHGAWTIADLMRLAQDTLYAHVEYACKRLKTRDIPDVIRQTLRSTSAFPINHKDPAKTPLPLAQVPLTPASSRKNRAETLKEIWEKPFMVKVPTIQRGAVDTSNLAHCQSGFHSNVNYFFADLEKPSGMWSRLIDQGHFDCVTLCQMTHWGRSTVFSVHATIKIIAEGLGLDDKALFSEEDAAASGSGILMPGARPPISEERFITLAAAVPLGLEWFATWFDAYFGGKGTREERLRYYAIFAASETVHAFYEQARTFGPISAGFIFTKARRERFFDCGAHARNPHYKQRLALENVSPNPELLSSEDTLQDHERIGVREDIVRVLQRIAEEGPKVWPGQHPPRPMVLRNGQSIRDEDRILVDVEVDEVGRRLASFAIQTAIRWRKQVKPGSPLRGLPPVFVEYASVYGASAHDEGLAEFHRSLKGLVEAPQREILQLRPSPTGDVLETSLREAKREANKRSTVRILVLDDLHLWPLEQLTIMLTAFKEAPNILAEMTHLIITGRAHGLSESSGGGNYAWELLSVAQKLSEQMLGTTVVSGLPALDRFSRNQGTLSAQLYAPELREEQYALNKERVHAASARDVITLICTANRQRGAERSPTVLVLSALQRTQNHLKRTWLEVDDSMVSGARSSVVFSTYQNFARMPSSFATSFAYVLFADAHYSGKGRFTYHHINSSFERATRSLYVLTEAGEKAGEALSNFHERFLQSDAKTDGLNMHVGRSNLLTSVFEKIAKTKTIASQLKADS